MSNRSPIITQNLVLILDDQPVTTSLKVAAVFGKNHRDVLTAIRGLNCSEDFRLRNFTQSSYINAQGRNMPNYVITRDGFSFLVMGFTGKEAAQWKERYIEAFNIMEKQLTTQQVPAPVMSELDILEAQVKALRSIEAKQSQTEQRVKAIEHKMETNGCTPGYIPISEAYKQYGMALSNQMFKALLVHLQVPTLPYSYQRPDTDEIGWGKSVKVEGIQTYVEDFIAECIQVSPCRWEHPAFGNKRFQVNTQGAA